MGMITRCPFVQSSIWYITGRSSIWWIVGKLSIWCIVGRPSIWWIIGRSSKWWNNGRPSIWGIVGPSSKWWIYGRPSIWIIGKSSGLWINGRPSIWWIIGGPSVYCEFSARQINRRTMKRGDRWRVICRTCFSQSPSSKSRSNLCEGSSCNSWRPSNLEAWNKCKGTTKVKYKRSGKKYIPIVMQLLANIKSPAQARHQKTSTLVYLPLSKLEFLPQFAFSFQ